MKMDLFLLQKRLQTRKKIKKFLVKVKKLKVLEIQGCSDNGQEKYLLKSYLVVTNLQKTLPKVTKM